MDYIQQLNEFYSTLNYNNLSTNAIAMYQAILHIANKAEIIENLSIANSTLKSICSLTDKELQNARNQLLNKKYIDYKKGANQNNAPKYSISILYKTTNSKIGQLQGNAMGRETITLTDNVGEQPSGYIYKTRLKTRLDLFFNFINNSTRDFLDEENITMKDKANIIMQLKRLNIIIEDVAVIGIMSEDALVQTKIFYWIVKELYCSVYKIYLNNLTYNILCLKFLKAKQYIATEEGYEVERIIGYVIKSLQQEFAQEKR